MTEIWKPIKGYEGLYEVSNRGYVKSLFRYINNNGTDVLHEGRILKPSIRNNYLSVILRKNNKSKCFSIHRLVAETFIFNPNNYPVVNHKDENRLNNNVNNLEWCTQKFNCNYGNHNKKISRAIKGKEIAQYILDGNLLKVWSYIGEAVRDGYDSSDISKCCRHIRQTYKDYKWKYLNN